MNLGFVKAQRGLQLVTDKLARTKVVATSDGTVLTVPVIVPLSL